MIISLSTPRTQKNYEPVIILLSHFTDFLNLPSFGSSGTGGAAPARLTFFLMRKGKVGFMGLGIGFETGDTVFCIDDIVGLHKEEGELGRAGLWGFVGNSVTDRRRDAFFSTGRSNFLGEGVVDNLILAVLLLVSSTNVVSASSRVDEEFARLMSVVSGVAFRNVVPPQLLEVPPSLIGLV